MQSEGSSGQGGVCCRGCGASVDPIRAGAVGIFATGVAYFCSATCKEEFALRRGESREQVVLGADRAGGRSSAPSTPAAEPLRNHGAAARATPAPARSIASPTLARPSFPSTAPAALLAQATTRRRAAWGLVAIGTAGAVAPLAPLIVRHGAVAYWIQAALLVALLSAYAFVVVRSLRGRRRSSGATIASGLSFAACALLGTVGVRALLGGGQPIAHVAFGFGASALAILWIGESAAERIRQVVRRALDARILGLPSEACVVRDGRRTAVPAGSVRPTDELWVQAGEVVAADGVIRSARSPSGSASALVTSPLVPDRMRSVTEGDGVVAGTRVESGELRVAASVASDQSAMTRLLGTERASAWTSTAVGKATDRLSRWGPALVVPASIGVAFALAAAPAARSAAWVAAASLLLACAPRSLRRLVPAALRAASLAALRRGILYRDLSALEAAGRTGIAAFIARGVVTTGEPKVVEIAVVGDRDETELLALGGGAERAGATHPFGRAIALYAEAHAGPLIAMRRATEQPGCGVTATSHGGEPVVVGTRQHLLAQGISVAAAEKKAAAFEERGCSAVFVAVGGKVQAALALRDGPRGEAAEAVRRLRAAGIEPVLLSGDSRAAVEALGHEVGVEHVRAAVEPAARGQEIQRLREAGTVVAVIGRPVQDALPLGAADVAVALAGTGRPEPHAAVLGNDDLGDAALALSIPHSALGVIRHGIWTGAVVTAAVAVGASCGVLPPPAVAALLAVTEVWVEWHAARLAGS